MTYISINTKSRQAKKIVELLETLPFAVIHTEPNTTTKKAMLAARQKRARKHKSSGELITFLNK